MSLNEKMHDEMEEINLDEIYPRTEYAEVKGFQALEKQIDKTPKAVQGQRRTSIPAYLLSSRQVAAIKQRKGT